MEITRNEASMRLYNGVMAELLANEKEYGICIASYDCRDKEPYFKMSIDEKAEYLAKKIQEDTLWALTEYVKRTLEHNEKEWEKLMSDKKGEK